MISINPEIDTYRAWLSGGVNRWHINDTPALRNSQDTNWAHSGRVAQLVALFGGTPDEVLIALFHDAGEKITGDKRGGSKTSHDYATEAEAAKTLGLETSKTPLVHLCDKLDGYLWARLHGSGLSSGWINDLDRLIEMSKIIGLEDEVSVIIAMANQP